ncbi:unnamed protein product [Fraxinus pennsylvanica]|uniref:Uncharacterized protein n=1 Tax=Fraxinus pennsylvanica TaxID=56036 RepID=A0AAD1ZFK9_9LAMI|nr:unnamed protein product [Fraxinus pennsylvanica]
MASESIDVLVHQSFPLEKSMSDSPKNLFDLPPDSFWVPKDYEQDWFDRNAMMQRKTSIKLGFLAGSTRNSKSFSHRSSLSSNQKHRPSLIGLAGTTQTPRLGIVRDANRQLNHVGSSWLFRSRSEPGGKPPTQLSEPGSPRVSCIGRVGLKNSGHRKTGILKLFNSIFRGQKGKLHVDLRQRMDRPVR